MREKFLRVRYLFFPGLIYTAVTGIELRGLASNCNQDTVGRFGDAFGTMWANWVQTMQKLPPWQPRTDFVNFPEGESFWTFDWWTSVIIRLPLQVLSRFFGPICGYNIMVAVGFLFTSISMYSLAYFLTKKIYISLLAGAMFGFGPFTQSAMTGHINYMFIGVYPILIYILITLNKRSNRGLTYSGLLLGVFSYIDGYYFIPALVSIFAVLLARAVSEFTCFWKLQILKSVTRHFFLSYFLVQIPILILYLSKVTSGNQVATIRDWNELNVYAIKWWHLLLPAPSNFYYERLVGEFQARRLGGSNFSETGLYPGVIFILFSFYSIYFYFVKPFLKEKFGSGSGKKETNETKQVLWLVFLTGVGIWIAMRPWISFGRLDLPAPSGLLFHFLPYWRTISRWGLLSTAAIIALGAIGLVQFLKARTKLVSIVVMILVTTSTALDIGLPHVLSPKVVSAIHMTGPYKWINLYTPRDSIILDVVPYSVDGFFLGMALTSQRKMANPLRYPEDEGALELLFPKRRDFLCNVNSAEIDYVIIHPLFYGSYEFPNLSGFEKIKQFESKSTEDFFKWDYSAVYIPTRSEQGNFFESYKSGFSLVDDGGLNATWYLLEPKGVIHISKNASSKVRKFTVQFRVKGYSEKIKIFSGGTLLYDGVIRPNNEVNVHLDILSKKEIMILRANELNNVSPKEPNLSVEIENDCLTSNESVEK